MKRMISLVPKEREPLILVGAVLRERAEELEPAMAELRRLIDTSGGDIKAELTQTMKRLHPATLIGPGKVEELKELVERTRVKTVVFDEDLTPAQQRNLDKLTGAKVLDRTHVILDIFAQRARTREGVLQVELAQLQYRLPRLGGLGKVLTQQVGRIGTRGPGEKMLETDRRHIQRRIDRLKVAIGRIERERAVQRRRRSSVPCPQVALVGYTNAGKSTLLNRLMKAPDAKRVYADDKLFATLDPTTRKVALPGGGWTLMTDTVGFIEKLPHSLVAAFRATLEETSQADLLVHLMDATSDRLEEHHRAVRTILGEIGAADLPTLEVLNKTDELEKPRLGSLQRRFPDAVALSAKTGFGQKEFLNRIQNILGKRWRETEIRLSPEENALTGTLFESAQVLERKMHGSRLSFRVRITPENLERFQSLRRK